MTAIIAAAVIATVASGGTATPIIASALIGGGINAGFGSGGSVSQRFFEGAAFGAIGAVGFYAGAAAGAYLGGTALGGGGAVLGGAIFGSLGSLVGTQAASKIVYKRNATGKELAWAGAFGFFGGVIYGAVKAGPSISTGESALIDTSTTGPEAAGSAAETNSSNKPCWGTGCDPNID